MRDLRERGSFGLMRRRRKQWTNRELVFLQVQRLAQYEQYIQTLLAEGRESEELARNKTKAKEVSSPFFSFFFKRLFSPVGVCLGRSTMIIIGPRLRFCSPDNWTALEEETAPERMRPTADFSRRSLPGRRLSADPSRQSPIRRPTVLNAVIFSFPKNSIGQGSRPADHTHARTPPTRNSGREVYRQRRLDDWTFHLWSLSYLLTSACRPVMSPKASMT